jgi:aryl carrier-like protein
VLLVLDSTNMARHLMLAAPILALGLPTLVILNMADDLRSRGGRVDLQKLAAELGAPVALVSARRAARASTRSSIFWRAPCRSPRPGNFRFCRMSPSAANGPDMWAARRRTTPRRHPNGRGGWTRYFCIRWRSAAVSGGGGGGVPDHFQRG